MKTSVATDVGDVNNAGTFQEPVGEKRLPCAADSFELLDEFDGVDRFFFVAGDERGVVRVIV